MFLLGRVSHALDNIVGGGRYGKASVCDPELKNMKKLIKNNAWLLFAIVAVRNVCDCAAKKQLTMLSELAIFGTLT